MNAYATLKPEDRLPDLLRSADIDKLFKRKRGWFTHSRVRARLYAAGFPHPCDRGRWSPIAVLNWMEGAGSNPGNVPPNVEPKPRRRGRRSSNAYAAVS